MLLLTQGAGLFNGDEFTFRAGGGAHYTKQNS